MYGLPEKYKQNLSIERETVFFKKKMSFLFRKKLDFIIIGAQKSGTTSLHNYLDKHPGIFMSKPLKEPRFFMPIKFVKEYYLALKRPIYIKNLNDLMNNYMLKGYEDGQLFGESSTDYTLADRAFDNNIPRKIYKHNKNIKLIYILRNPFKRLFSNYQHDQRMGRYIDASFEDYLEKEHDNLVKTSLYHYQICQYLQYFPQKNILLLCFSDLVENTNVTLEKTFNFLGVPPDNYTFLDTYKKYNAGEGAGEKNVFDAFNKNNKIIEIVRKDANKLKDQFHINVQ